MKSFKSSLMFTRFHLGLEIQENAEETLQSRELLQVDQPNTSGSGKDDLHLDRVLFMLL